MDFFKINQIKFSNINIEYNSELSPVFIKQIKILNKQIERKYSISIDAIVSKHEFKVDGYMKNEDSRTRVELNMVPYDNSLNFNVIEKEQHIQGELVAKLSNRDIISKIFKVDINKIPNRFDFNFRSYNEKLDFTSINVIYPSSTLKAEFIIKNKGSPLFVSNISAKESLLKSLMILNENKCNLPYLLTLALKGFNTNINLHILDSKDSLNKVDIKSQIQFNLQGVKFNKDPLPKSIKKYLDICFGYTIK